MPQSYNNQLLERSKTNNHAAANDTSESTFKTCSVKLMLELSVSRVSQLYFQLTKSKHAWHDHTFCYVGAYPGECS